MASNADLQQEIRTLATKFNELEEKFEQVLTSVSPQCHFCGGRANQRKRIFLGRVKYALDVWVCQKCSSIESAKSV